MKRGATGELNVLTHSFPTRRSSDLVVADMCDRINVMYGGVIVESGTTRDIFYTSKHPYTLGLLKSVPNPERIGKERLKPILGTPPDLLSPPKGCPFYQRCDYSMKVCENQMPPFFNIKNNHKSACWLNHEKAPKVDF